MKKNRCYNCCYFNGEQGDGDRFCDDKEVEVNENNYCHRYKPDAGKGENHADNTSLHNS